MITFPAMNHNCLSISPLNFDKRDTISSHLDSQQRNLLKQYCKSKLNPKTEMTDCATSLSIKSSKYYS